MKARLHRGLLCLLMAGLTSPLFAALHVGVARADITPLLGETMTAMGGAVVSVEKINDPLSAKVVILQNGADALVMVSLELLDADDDRLDAIRDQIRQQTGIDNVFCAVTHTHGSGRSSPEHISRITPLIIKAAVQAHADLQPARLGYAHGELHEGYNRRIINSDGTGQMMWNNRDRIPSGPTDPAVGVMVIKHAKSDAVIATLVNYAVHPVISMNFSELIVSADYPGAMANEVEATVGGLCVFFLGAAGDINPFDADMFRYATAEEAFAQVKMTGHLLAHEVLKTVRQVDQFDANPGIDYAQRMLPMANRSEGPAAAKNRSVELNTVLIGDAFAMVTMPGELFVELGLDLKARSPAETTWVLGLTNEIQWYIPTLKATTEGGYGASTATDLEVGAGERLVLEAVVTLHHQMGLVKPLK